MNLWKCPCIQVHTYWHANRKKSKTTQLLMSSILVVFVFGSRKSYHVPSSLQLWMLQALHVEDDDVDQRPGNEVEFIACVCRLLHQSPLPRLCVYLR